MKKRLPLAIIMGRAFAQATIASRKARRRLMAQILLAIVILFAVGNWPLATFLGKSAIWFLVWWGVVAGLTIVMALMAVIDVARVPKEEREKLGLD